MSTYEPEDELVEVAARAAHADDLAHGHAGVAWEHMDTEAHDWYRSNARAVLRTVGPTLLARGLRIVADEMEAEAVQQTDNPVVQAVAGPTISLLRGRADDFDGGAS